jgi:choline dehydrogenase-like flavoprotein
VFPRSTARAASSTSTTPIKAHEIDDLYVADTSVFPSIGAVNPALTAMADALPVGDHLLERMGVGSSAGPSAGASS